ncbi:MAG: nucleotide exchange factor GrpE [Bacteroidetes bacterium]|nr:nucleotide exchange factor GrpE [Bacteroidota bacterium]
MAEKELENNSNETGEESKQEADISHELPEATESVLQIEELQKQLDQYKDLLLRKAAEFDNYRRRVEGEMSNVLNYATESLLGDLLPVLDDFERSLKHMKETIENESLVKGVELIYQKFLKIMEGRGVKPFDTVGKEFNVDYHDALLQIPRSDVPNHTIIEEVEKGYMLNNKVIRHAKVIVSSAPDDAPEEAKDAESSDEVTGK